MSLSITGLTCGYGDQSIVENISLQADLGEILCVLGPNGVGKTTFFKTLLGFIKAKSGEIRIGDRAIQSLSNRELAKWIAYVPQAHAAPFPYLVREVIVMGRTAHLNMFALPTKADYELVEQVMQQLDIAHLADKNYTEISGGERQLVLIARALVQQTKILVMDEPTSNLDFGNQVRVLRQINAIAQTGILILMTSHVPDHAFLCSARIVLFMKGGDKRFIIGDADEVMTSENLRKAYGVDVVVSDIGGHRKEVIKVCVPVMN